MSRPAVGAASVAQASPADKLVSRAAATTVAALAGLAGAISYSHMRQLAQEHGQTGWHAHAFPLSVDGLELVASLVLLAERRHGRRSGWLSDLGLLKINQSVLSLAASLPAPSVARHILPGVGDLGFHQAISRMANSWDYGLLGINQQFANGAAALVASRQDLIRTIAGLNSISAAAAGSLVNFAAINVAAGLTDLFRSWHKIAETGLGGATSPCPRRVRGSPSRSHSGAER